jgi:lauroyl/myristoyl acyltransferase
MPSRRETMTRHQRRVAGSGAAERVVRRRVRRAFVSYANYWREAFQAPVLSRRELEEAVSFEGFEHVYDALDEGRGVLFALPHLGSWDFGAAWLSAIGLRMAVVVEPLEPPALFEWFVDLRRSFGLEVVPLGREASSFVAGRLRSGGIVALVADRDLSGRGVPVRFFGEVTRLPAGPATLALRTGAALVPAAVYAEGRGRHRVVVTPPLEAARSGTIREDVARITQALAVRMEELIRRAPEQWHLFQPNWPSDPGYRAEARRGRAGGG